MDESGRRLGGRRRKHVFRKLDRSSGNAVRVSLKEQKERCRKAPARALRHSGKCKGRGKDRKAARADKSHRSFPTIVSAHLKLLENSLRPCAFAVGPCLMFVEDLGYVHGDVHQSFLHALTGKVNVAADYFDAERVLVMGRLPRNRERGLE